MRAKSTYLALAFLVCGASSLAVAQTDNKVQGPKAIHDVTAKHYQEAVSTLLQLGSIETPFDYVAPVISGPVVVLEGFTANGALKTNAETQIKKLSWVTHVVNEIEYLDSGPELRRARQQALAILERMVPQAFPQQRANIRIKITVKGDVTLVGVIDKPDKVRFEAAVEQIKHMDFVGSVKSDVVESS